MQADSLPSEPRGSPGYNLFQSPSLVESVSVSTQRLGFLGGSVVKNLPAMQETQVQFLGWEDPLEKELATHSNILSRKIPRTEEPGGTMDRGIHGVAKGLDMT